MKKCVVVMVVALALVLCASQAFADRLVLTPTGSVLGRADLRGEAAFGPDDTRLYWVNVGLGLVELEGSRMENDAGLKEDILSAEAALLPETILTPAVGVGVRDISDEIERGYYVAVTKTVPLTDKIPFFLHDVKLHAGYGIDGINGLFGGAEIGLPMGFVLAGEYDGENTNASLSWEALPMVGLKVYSLDSEIFFGASFKSAF